MFAKDRDLLCRLAGVEGAIARLYTVFAAAFPEDHSFWAKLGKEREQYAKALSNLHAEFCGGELFPKEFSTIATGKVFCWSERLDTALAEAVSPALNRITAYQIALDPNVAGTEVIYEKMASAAEDDRAARTFFNINRACMENAGKIRSRLANIGYGSKYEGGEYPRGAIPADGGGEPPPSMPRGGVAPKGGKLDWNVAPIEVRDVAGETDVFKLRHSLGLVSSSLGGEKMRQTLRATRSGMATVIRQTKLHYAKLKPRSRAAARRQSSTWLDRLLFWRK